MEEKRLKFLVFAAVAFALVVVTVVTLSSTVSYTPIASPNLASPVEQPSSTNNDNNKPITPGSVTIPSIGVESPSVVEVEVNEEAASELNQGSIVFPSTLPSNQDYSLPQTSLRQAPTGIQIVYDFMCLNNFEGKYVALEVRGGNSSFIRFNSAFPDVALKVGLIVTPGSDKNGFKGHNQPNETASFTASYGTNIDLPEWTPVNRFNKGGPSAGSPLWDSSTGNPYIYFSAANGWTCTLEQNIDPNAFSCPTPTSTCGSTANDCETIYDRNGGDYTDACVFKYNHYFSKNPHTTLELIDENYGPPRFRRAGDIFVGRCNQYQNADGDVQPDFTVSCCTTTAAPDAVSLFPSCGSYGHNIGFGLTTVVTDHHRIIASQISPKKFIGCNAADPCSTNSTLFSCAQGAGPHETFQDDTCFTTPMSGAFIDKSAGYNNAQMDVPCEFTEGGNFTSCGVGGNPCITTFDCSIGGSTTPCMPNTTSTNVLTASECSGCHGGPGKYSGDGCSCNDITKNVRDIIAVPCGSGSD